MIAGVKLIRKFVRRIGFDLVRYPIVIENASVDHLAVNRVKLIHAHNIDLVLDVGANTGAYVKELRSLGYYGQIEAFEPLTVPFERLSSLILEDDKLNVHNIALGESHEESFINVAGNSVSSSILGMRPLHEQSAPYSKYVSKQGIIIEPLSLFMENYVRSYRGIYLKMDVQGFERQVLKGLGSCINNIKGIQTEMSLEMLYENELTFFEFSNLLLGLGFKLESIEPGFYDDRTGQLLQLDGIWYR